MSSWKPTIRYAEVGPFRVKLESYSDSLDWGRPTETRLVPIGRRLVKIESSRAARPGSALASAAALFSLFALAAAAAFAGCV